MELPIIIDRLQLTIDRLKELPEEAFNYSAFVSESDTEQRCGTVCCVAGWYPQWFPEAGLIWSREWKDGKLIIATSPECGISTVRVMEALKLYHRLSYKEIEALFYGRRLSYPITLENTTDIYGQIMVNEKTTLKAVIERFEKLKHYYANELSVLRKKILESF